MPVLQIGNYEPLFTRELVHDHAFKSNPLIVVDIGSPDLKAYDGEFIGSDQIASRLTLRGILFRRLKEVKWWVSALMSGAWKSARGAALDRNRGAH